MVRLFKKKEITTAYLFESKEQTEKSGSAPKCYTCCHCAKEMIHVLIATRVKKKEKKKSKSSEKDSVAMVKNLFKISPNADKTIFITNLTLPASTQLHLLTLTNLHRLK